MDRVLREMGVASRRLDIAVAEQLVDHRQGFLERQRTGREGVAQIIKVATGRLYRDPP